MEGKILTDQTGEVIDTDLLIIGSEGAGARAAIEASEHDINVLIVTKGRIGRSGATLTAAMDMAVDSKSAVELLGLPGDTHDSKEIFFNDLVKGGGYINNQKLVKMVVDEAAQRAKELQDWGLKWVNNFRMPGHSYPRSIWSSGQELMQVLRRKVREAGVDVIEDTMVTELLHSNGRITGAIALNARKGEPIVFRAKSVILATGGGMRIYQRTTAPEELTGDGYAMAYRAGLELVDMEFPQFIPVSFTSPPALDGVEYGPYGILLDIHGWLLNKWGERFLTKWDPEHLEHATRDVVARAIATEIAEGRGGSRGGVYASVAHLPDRLLKDYLPWKRGWINSKAGYGFRLIDFIDLVKEKSVEVAPACHYFCGGVRINEHMETAIAGLYACGEVSGGVVGGNRLSGTAISEALVEGARAGRWAAEYAVKVETPSIDKAQVDSFQKKMFSPLKRNEGSSPIELRRRLQKIATEKVGLIRNGPALLSAIDEITRMQTEDLPRICSGNKSTVYNREWVEALQIENLLCMLEMVAQAALLRTESRACHLRTDYLKTDESWIKNIVVKKEDGEMKLSVHPVVAVETNQRIVSKKA